MRRAIGGIAGAEVYVSGQAAIEHDLDPVFADDIFVGEVLIAIPVALLILVFVFGTLAFVIPLLFAAVAIPSTLGIIWIFANFLELSTYLQNLVMLIGLGVAVDYSLLIVYRYREELRAGRSADDAIARTMATAGGQSSSAARRLRSASRSCSSCRCRSCEASASVSSSRSSRSCAR